MRRTEWFQRQFPAIADNGLLPGILERLSGTPARLRAMVADARPRAAESGWSAAKELGHLSDIEPLWLARVQAVAEPLLSAAVQLDRSWLMPAALGPEEAASAKPPIKMQ